MKTPSLSLACMHLLIFLATANIAIEYMRANGFSFFFFSIILIAIANGVAAVWAAGGRKGGHHG